MLHRRGIPALNIVLMPLGTGWSRPCFQHDRFWTHAWGEILQLKSSSRFAAADAAAATT